MNQLRIRLAAWVASARAAGLENEDIQALLGSILTGDHTTTGTQERGART
jgi:hypothetical protein